MARQVLRSDEIAGAWVHQTQASARCSARMSFEGRAFYSYGTIIAAIVEHEGRAVFLITDGHYSDTTSRHKNLVRCTIPKNAKVFTVPGVARGQLHSFTDPRRILTGWRLAANWQLEQAAKAREPKKTRLVIEAYQTVLAMREYAAHFGASLDGFGVALPLSEKSIRKIIRERERQAPIAYRERLERARLKDVMRNLQPPENRDAVTARTAYRAWQAAHKNRQEFRRDECEAIAA